MEQSHTIGIVSDTHGSLPAFVTKNFKKLEVCHIIHAGDIGNSSIISTLQKIAPTSWVCGNMDNHQIGHSSAIAQVGGVSVYILHNLYDLDIDPPAAQMSAVIHGHLHLPSISWQQDVLYLNPGSCSYPRGGHPPSCAVIRILNNKLDPRILYK